ncbi:hypothetical protein ZWY2020_028860 [Hordeum vulgare]|nr:hypothetical protein ZWY2020_028860 [Hordeum vulgare]
MPLLCLRLLLPAVRPNPNQTTKSFFSLSSCWLRVMGISPTNHHKQMSLSSSFATAVAEGSAARRFWIATSSREAAFTTYTPFLLSLATGSLRLDSFRHYLAHDAHFLHAFARA